MVDFSSAVSAVVEFVEAEWRLSVVDGEGQVLVLAALPAFGPDHFFTRGGSDQPAGLEYVGPFLNRRGLYYTEWKGQARDGWVTQLHY